MTDIPRLNGIIRCFEQGVPAFASFASPDINSGLAFSTSKYDGVVFEMEHNPYDISGLRDAFYYMQNRALIAAAASIAPAVTPIVRIPPNGGEMNQFLAKQVLDVGAYGVVWPHISNAQQAYNAVAACRYPRPKDSPNFEPEGVRGDGPSRAMRYWGLKQQDYYNRAGVWPLDPKGEVLVVLMIEDSSGIANLDDILKTVPGIGMVLIGEGDLSQELGYPRQYDHPVVRDAMAQVLGTSKTYNVPVGHPHVNAKNVERVLSEGYRFLMSGPVATYPGLEKGLELCGRAKPAATASSH